jgi:hypothetical protein
VLAVLAVGLRLGAGGGRRALTALLGAELGGDASGLLGATLVLLGLDHAGTGLGDRLVVGDQGGAGLLAGGLLGVGQVTVGAARLGGGALSASASAPRCSTSSASRRRRNSSMGVLLSSWV